MEQAQQQYLQNSIIGALELALFMKQGAQRFYGDINAMWRSFIIAFALMPLSFYMLYLSQPDRPEIAGIETSQMFTLFFVKGLVTMALNLGVIYIFARAYDRLDKFYLTITAANWSSIFPTLLFLPVMASYALGWYSWDDIYGISIVFAIYGYFIAGFMLTHCLRIPWEMAGFLTIVLLAINETGFDIIYWIAS